MAWSDFDTSKKCLNYRIVKWERGLSLRMQHRCKKVTPPGVTRDAGNLCTAAADCSLSCSTNKQSRVDGGHGRNWVRTKRKKGMNQNPNVGRIPKAGLNGKHRKYQRKQRIPWQLGFLQHSKWLGTMTGFWKNWRFFLHQKAPGTKESGIGNKETGIRLGKAKNPRAAKSLNKKSRTWHLRNCWWRIRAQLDPGLGRVVCPGGAAASHTTEH